MNFKIHISSAYPSIADEINDLMEEYGQDNDLPEGWWFDLADTDEVFINL